MTLIPETELDNSEDIPRSKNELLGQVFPKLEPYRQTDNVTDNTLPPRVRVW